MLEEKKNISGPFIKRLREGHDMSQQVLVKMLAELGVNLSTASLSKIETQKRGVSDIELQAFSAVFGVPADSLLCNG